MFQKRRVMNTDHFCFRKSITELIAAAASIQRASKAADLQVIYVSWDVFFLSALHCGQLN